MARPKPTPKNEKRFFAGAHIGGWASGDSPLIVNVDESHTWSEALSIILTNGASGGIVIDDQFGNGSARIDPWTTHVENAQQGRRFEFDGGNLHISDLNTNRKFEAVTTNVGSRIRIRSTVAIHFDPSGTGGGSNDGLLRLKGATASVFGDKTISGRVGIGKLSTGSKVDISAEGDTDSTISLRIQDSTGSPLLRQYDKGLTVLGVPSNPKTPSSRFENSGFVMNTNGFVMHRAETYSGQASIEGATIRLEDYGNSYNLDIVNGGGNSYMIWRDDGGNRDLWFTVGRGSKSVKWEDADQYSFYTGGGSGSFANDSNAVGRAWIGGQLFELTPPGTDGTITTRDSHNFRLVARYYDGTNDQKQAAKVQHVAENTSGSTRISLGIPATSGSELLSLKSSGKVGVKETDPSARLHVNGEGSTSATSSIRVHNSAPNRIFEAFDDGTFMLGPVDDYSPQWTVNVGSDDNDQFIRGKDSTGDLTYEVRGRNVRFEDASQDVRFLAGFGSSDGTKIWQDRPSAGGFDFRLYSAIGSGELQLTESSRFTFYSNGEGGNWLNNNVNVARPLLVDENELSSTPSATDSNNTIKSSAIFRLAGRYYDGTSDQETQSDLQTIIGDTNGNSRLAFSLDGTEGMALTDNLRLGIGFTAPSQSLDVNGNIRSVSTFMADQGVESKYTQINGNSYAIYDDTDTNIFTIQTANVGNRIRFQSRYRIFFDPENGTAEQNSLTIEKNQTQSAANLNMLATGTADSNTASYDSQAINLIGSYWDGSAAQNNRGEIQWLQTTSYGRLNFSALSGALDFNLKEDGKVGIQTGNPQAKVHAIGEGDTDATSSLRIDNSTTSQKLEFLDNGTLFVGEGTITGNRGFVAKTTDTGVGAGLPRHFLGINYDPGGLDLRTELVSAQVHVHNVTDENELIMTAFNGKSFRAYSSGSETARLELGSGTTFLYAGGYNWYTETRNDPVKFNITPDHITIGKQAFASSSSTTENSLIQDFRSSYYISGENQDKSTIQRIQDGATAGGGRFNFSSANGSMDINFLDSGEVGIGTSTPNASLEVQGSVATAIANITSDYTATLSDHTLFNDASGGPITDTVPNGASAPGVEFWICKKDSSGNAVTIQGDGCLINGQSSIDLTQEGETVIIKSDGTNYFIF